ncbi:MAG: hypothetical protein ACXW18_12265 [Pyrinomonadaceae bacterium]
MSHQQPFRFLTLPRLLIFAVLLLASFTVSAQPQSQPQTTDPWSGNYKGTAKMESGEMDVKLEIKSANDKFSGRAVAGDQEYTIASGKVEGGKLTIKFGAEPDAAMLTLQKVEDKLVGQWVRGAQKGTVELKKYVPEVFTAEMLNGEWDAVADAGGQPFPFVLTLKVEGEKVTGTSNSQLGSSNISSGTWKDGKLAVILEAGSGQITLVAEMIDGKLTGEYDFAGQSSGKWVAIKKK